MDQFSGLAPEQQAIAGIAFLIAMGVLAAWSKFRGHQEGPPKPKVQEFAVAGQLADMGPVKELVEGVGLLIQQQVRTNMHLEACARALQAAADAYAGELAAERNEAEMEAEVERRVEKQLRERRTRARRAAKPRPSG